MNLIEKLRHLDVPGPTITSVTKPFWEGVASGEFLIQKCGECDKNVFYPRTHCPHCWSNRLEWTPASGKARLKTYSVVHHPGHPGWQDVAPYPLGIIELEEGPSMLTQLLVDSPEDLKMGDALHVKFVEVNEIWRPFFERDSSRD
ncbi:Zn-ribbon domain-containing OB-fold protein [Oceanobacillus rekensis]|uniref:Zn-ribbon domain-containing OB-fold protein n=1 Tax=Oceanobacillus rekensis TaxID=937927 RepID=UPI000B42DBA0|nr:OB-fold domain-containing protein [Oceanobacillus rekensis]